MSMVQRLDSESLMQPPANEDQRLDSLRIAVFVSEFPALSETFVLRQVVGLIDRGHDVTVFADRPRREPLTHPDFARYDLGARTRYLDMPSDRFDRLLAGAAAVVRHAGQGTLAPLRALNVLRHGRDAINLRLLFWVLRLLEEERFDVLHCHFGPVGDMVAALRRMGAVDGRLATSFHGADLTVFLRNRPRYYRCLAARGDLFLPISDYLARRLADLGCPSERIAVLRMGVNLDRFVERPRQYAAGQPFRLLTIGRLTEKKGIADGLRAVANARRRGASLLYTVIGDGPLRGVLQALARELGIGDIVTFAGWQVQDAVIEALYDHHALLAPSVTAPNGDQEGIPVTLMEAMATGMPVISTRHSGIPELVQDGVSGLLADEGDPGALAVAILDLVGAPDRAGAMGRAARQRVMAAYDAAALDDQLDRCLRDLAARPG